VRQTIETQWRAAQLRAAGATFREIGETLGIDPSWARTLVLRALEAAQYEAADMMRVQEGLRLDRLQRAFWPQAVAGDDRAAKIILRTMDRRARLFGLDAPVKVQAEMVYDGAELEREVAELERQLESLEDRPPDLDPQTGEADPDRPAGGVADMADPDRAGMGQDQDGGGVADLAGAGGTGDPLGGDSPHMG
jgi:hypothetical protein